MTWKSPSWAYADCRTYAIASSSKGYSGMMARYVPQYVHPHSDGSGYDGRLHHIVSHPCQICGRNHISFHDRHSPTHQHHLTVFSQAAGNILPLHFPSGYCRQIHSHGNRPFPCAQQEWLVYRPPKCSPSA